MTAVVNGDKLSPFENEWPSDADERLKIIRQKSLELLKSIDPNIHEVKLGTKHERGGPNFYHAYSLVKKTRK